MAPLEGDELPWDHVDSVAIHVGPTWEGFDSLTQLFVLGDSYSDTAWAHHGMNWAEYLAQDRTSQHHPLTVYNVAKGGSTVSDLDPQFLDLQEVMASSSTTVAFTPSSLFVIWIGINDVCDDIDPEACINEIFDVAKMTRAQGATNLLFIDVPSRRLTYPRWNRDEKMISRWNSALRSKLHDISVTEPFKDCTLLVYSAHNTFRHILDNPTRYGFNEMDPRAEGGGIWYDGVHPHNKVHRIIADDMTSYLFTVKKC